MKKYAKGGIVEPPEQKELIVPLNFTSPKYRTCEVRGKKATFHRWGDFSEIVPPSFTVDGHNGGTVAATMGIVEYEDGTIDRVYPEKIKFLDNLFKRERS